MTVNGLNSAMPSIQVNGEKHTQHHFNICQPPRQCNAAQNLLWYSVPPLECWSLNLFTTLPLNKVCTSHSVPHGMHPVIPLTRMWVFNQFLVPSLQDYAMQYSLLQYKRLLTFHHNFIIPLQSRNDRNCSRQNLCPITTATLTKSTFISSTGIQITLNLQRTQGELLYMALIYKCIWSLPLVQVFHNAEKVKIYLNSSVVRSSQKQWLTNKQAFLGNAMFLASFFCKAAYTSSGDGEGI